MRPAVGGTPFCLKGDWEFTLFALCLLTGGGGGGPWVVCLFGITPFCLLLAVVIGPTPLCLLTGGVCPRAMPPL